eukprot:SAG31_NODE_122_length_23797_cov_39.343812_27_plen_67_part_00
MYSGQELNRLPGTRLWTLLQLCAFYPKSIFRPGALVQHLDTPVLRSCVGGVAFFGVLGFGFWFVFF